MSLSSTDVGYRELEFFVYSPTSEVEENLKHFAPNICPIFGRDAIISLL